MGKIFSEQVESSAVESEIAEVDEMYHYIGFRADTETKENVYIIALVSREPRQFLGLIASRDKSPETIEKLVLSSPPAKQYYSDGYQGYKYIDFPGHFTQNFKTKENTFTVEGANMDLRTFVPTLQRKSRCFPRKIENLNAVLKLLAYAYCKFGQWKLKNRIPVKHKSPFPSKHLRKFRYPKLSHLDFLFGH